MSARVETIQARGPAPRVLLIGAGALVGFTMLAVFVGRGEGGGMTALPASQSVARLEFRAEDLPDGSIALRDVADGQVVGLVRPGEGGFVRGTLRGLAQARQRGGQGPEAPFSLTRFADGRLALADEATGRAVPLEVFGPTNAQDFARLMPGAASGASSGDADAGSREGDATRRGSRADLRSDRIGGGSAEAH